MEAAHREAFAVQAWRVGFGLVRESKPLERMLRPVSEFITGLISAHCPPKRVLAAWHAMYDHLFRSAGDGMPGFYPETVKAWSFLPTWQERPGVDSDWGDRLKIVAYGDGVDDVLEFGWLPATPGHTAHAGRAEPPRLAALNTAAWLTHADQTVVAVCAARLSTTPMSSRLKRFKTPAVWFSRFDKPDEPWAGILADAIDEAGYPDADLTARLRVGGLVTVKAVLDVCFLESHRLTAVRNKQPVKCNRNY